MKHALFIFISVFFITQNVRAEVEVISLDTSINKINYKLSRNEFLEYYGKNDSTKAFINFYFNKRGNRLVEAIFLVATNGALVLALKHNQNIQQTPDSGYFFLVVAGPLLIATATFTLYFIVQEIKRSILTKKKLYKILDKYNHGVRLPERITRKRKFKIELDKLHGKYPQFRLF